MWEVGMVSGKGGVEEGLVPKPGEKTSEESYKDQKAKVDGFFSNAYSVEKRSKAH